MGCGAGACQSKAVIIPSKIPSLTTKLQLKLSWLKQHPSQLSKTLQFSQIQQIEQYLAANQKLPQLSILTRNNAAESMQLLNEMERAIWKILIFGNITNKQLTCQPGIKFNAQINDSDEIIENSFNQISLDLNRTFPQIKTISREHLQLVLRNITNHFVGIGYTQGMNFYAAFLLLCGFTPQEAFYIFVGLFQKVQFLFIDIFSSTFRLTTRCLEYINNKSKLIQAEHLNIGQNQKCSQCVQIDHPLKLEFSHLCSLLDQFEQTGISPHLYSFSWFLTIFLYTLDLSCCVIIWDFMIKSGKGICAIVDLTMVILCQIGEQWLKQGHAQGDKIQGGIHMMEIVRGNHIRDKFNVNQIVKITKALKQCQHLVDSHSEQVNEEVKSIQKFICKKSDIFGLDKDLREMSNDVEISDGDDAYKVYITGVRNVSRDADEKKEGEKEKQLLNKMKKVESSKQINTQKNNN